MIRVMMCAGLATGLGAVPALAQAADPAPTVVATPAPVDPVRLAIARTTVDFIFPKGTYARIMDRTLNTMIQPMMDGFGKIPLRDLAGIGGTSPEKVAAMGPGTLKEIMEIIDPAYRQRSQAMMAGMFHELGGMMADFEPTMRNGLANAYARRFTVQQLNEMNTFFATATGRAYAAESMTIFTDPDVTAAMQAFTPRMLKQMPELIKKVTASTANLPPRRELRDLTPAQRKRLAELLGVKESDLQTKEPSRPGSSS